MEHRTGVDRTCTASHHTLISKTQRLSQVTQAVNADQFINVCFLATRSVHELSSVMVCICMTMSYLGSNYSYEHIIVVLNFALSFPRVARSET